MRVDPDRQRAMAAALARKLEPLIAEHFRDGKPAGLTKDGREARTFVRPLEKPVLDAAIGVSNALTRFEQAQFTGNERTAQRALFEATRRLREKLGACGHG